MTAMVPFLIPVLPVQQPEFSQHLSPQGRHAAFFLGFERRSLQHQGLPCRVGQLVSAFLCKLFFALGDLYLLAATGGSPCWRKCRTW